MEFLLVGLSETKMVGMMDMKTDIAMVEMMVALMAFSQAAMKDCGMAVSMVWSMAASMAESMGFF